MSDTNPVDSPELYRSLGRIEGKLDSLASSFVAHLQEDASSFKEVKLRISNLEYKLVACIGALGVLGFLLPFVVNNWPAFKKVILG